MRSAFNRTNDIFEDHRTFRIQNLEHFNDVLNFNDEVVLDKVGRTSNFNINDAAEVVVIGYFKANTENSILEIIQDSYFSFGPVHWILKKYKFIAYPLKMLLAEDPTRKLFSVIGISTFARNPNINNFCYILWSSDFRISNPVSFSFSVGCSLIG